MHGGAGGAGAVCVTANARPPTLIPVERDDAPVLAVTEYAIEPFPLPLVPDVMLSHEVSPLVAVQVHPVPVDTEMLPDPPAATIEALVGLML